LLASSEDIEEIGHNENYTFTWLRLGSNPTQQQLDHILEQIRSRARGYHVSFIYKCCLNILGTFIKTIQYRNLVDEINNIYKWTILILNTQNAF